MDDDDDESDKRPRAFVKRSTLHHNDREGNRRPNQNTPNAQNDRNQRNSMR